MKNIATILAVTMLSGCAAIETIETATMAAVERRCLTYGFQPGTDAMAYCQMQVRQRASDRLRQDMQWHQIQHMVNMHNLAVYK